MIYGEILKQVNEENQFNEDTFTLDIMRENVEMADALYEMGLITEAQRQTKSSIQLKYCFKKWLDKERALPEIDKDIAKCDKIIEKVQSQLDNYEEGSKPSKIFKNIMSFIMTSFGFGSGAYHMDGDTDRKGIESGTVGMRAKGEVKSMWEVYKRDLILCIEETKKAKKYLEELKKKKQKQK